MMVCVYCICLCMGTCDRECVCILYIDLTFSFTLTRAAVQGKGLRKGPFWDGKSES